MIELQKDNLLEELNDNRKVIVQYSASWCGNCKIVKPKFKKLSEEYKNIKFIYVDSEHFPGTKKFAEIKYLPTFAGFLDGELILQNTGNKEQNILDIIDAIEKEDNF